MLPLSQKDQGDLQMSLTGYPTDFPQEAATNILKGVINPSSLSDKHTLQVFAQSVYTVQGYVMNITIGAPNQLVGAVFPWITLIELLLSIAKQVIDNLPKPGPAPAPVPAH
jgi:hypothetical protein